MEPRRCIQVAKEAKSCEEDDGGFHEYGAEGNAIKVGMGVEVDRPPLPKPPDLEATEFGDEVTEVSRRAAKLPSRESQDPEAKPSIMVEARPGMVARRTVTGDDMSEKKKGEEHATVKEFRVSRLLTQLATSKSPDPMATTSATAAKTADVRRKKQNGGECMSTAKLWVTKSGGDPRPPPEPPDSLPRMAGSGMTAREVLPIANPILSRGCKDREETCRARQEPGQVYHLMGQAQISESSVMGLIIDVKRFKGLVTSSEGVGRPVLKCSINIGIPCALLETKGPLCSNAITGQAQICEVRLAKLNMAVAKSEGLVLHAGNLLPFVEQPFHQNWVSLSARDKCLDNDSGILIFAGDLDADVIDSLLHETSASAYGSHFPALTIVARRTKKGNHLLFIMSVAKSVCDQMSSSKQLWIARVITLVRHMIRPRTNMTAPKVEVSFSSAREDPIIFHDFISVKAGTANYVSTATFPEVFPMHYVLKKYGFLFPAQGLPSSQERVFFFKLWDPGGSLPSALWFFLFTHHLSP